MKWILAVAVLTASPVTNACQSGYKPTDVPGVCVEVNQEEVNPTWVSNEKPPSDKMPSYQREGITVISAPSMADSDAQADLDRLSADKEGKRKAGIR